MNELFITISKKIFDIASVIGLRILQFFLFITFWISIAPMRLFYKQDNPENTNFYDPQPKKIDFDKMW